MESGRHSQSPQSTSLPVPRPRSRSSRLRNPQDRPLGPNVQNRISGEQMVVLVSAVRCVAVHCCCSTVFHTETAPRCEFTVLKRVKYQNHVHFHTEGPRKSSKLKLTLRRRITRCETANTHTDASLRRYCTQEVPGGRSCGSRSCLCFTGPYLTRRATIGRLDPPGSQRPKGPIVLVFLSFCLTSPVRTERSQLVNVAYSI